MTYREAVNHATDRGLRKLSAGMDHDGSTWSLWISGHGGETLIIRSPTRFPLDEDQEIIVTDGDK